MEGAFRPGHFNGVAQVVSRLFDIVKPDRAYFGLKDFQQLAIIRQMVQQLNLPVTIVACDIVREADGLAMSSRNTLLTPEHRKAAPLIRQTLLRAREQAFTLPLETIKSEVVETINSSETLKVEYFEVVDATTLQPVASLVRENQAIGCIAVFAGKVRLIDNILF